MKNKTKKRVGVIAMMLMVIVAIGATAGTTLAKYIYSATVTDTATVAKWGFTVTANTKDLFSEQYNASKMVSGKTKGDYANVDVYADAKVVAPGTSNNNDEVGGEMIITINGSAEVNAQLVIDITDFETVWLNQEVESVAKIDGEDTTEENNTLGEGKYYPLQWTFKAGSGDNLLAADLTLDPSSSTSLNEQLAASLTNAFKYSISENMNVLPANATVSDESTGSKVVINLPAGTTFNNFKLTIGWEWPFEQDMDVQDTILGALAANEAKVEAEEGEPTANYLYTSADDGDTITEIDMSKYAETDYNLSVTFSCKATLVQTTNA